VVAVGESSAGRSSSISWLIAAAADQSSRDARSWSFVATKSCP